MGALSGSFGGPRVQGSSIRFELADPDHRHRAATLYQEVRRPRLGPAMAAVEGGWSASLPIPAVDRLEYQFVLQRRDGRTEWLLDPSNPRRAEGPFGAKSVVELPGYRSPRWLGEAAAADTRVRSLRVRSRRLGGTVAVQLWSSPGTGTPDIEVPLLLVADGPEYARFAGLLTFLAAAVRGRLLPSHRAALLQPGRRDEEYSANPEYAAALVSEVIPAVEGRVAVTPGSRVSMGASLGGVAMLHAHRLHPGLCAGLFLQSSSFFRRPHDDHEGWMRCYPRVVAFVDSLLGAPFASSRPVPSLLTCGTVEENLFGNRRVRDALAAQGYPVRLIENRDAHNWTSWRDTFDPHLLGFLRERWR
jgi:enterochelin esterase-like enzyme